MARHCNGSPYCNQPPTRRGLCPTHAQQRDRTEPHPNAHFYNSTTWRKLRTLILRLEPNCRHCGQPATDVDHIRSIEDGGPRLDPANLQPLCSVCHGRKTRAEVLERRRRG